MVYNGQDVTDATPGPHKVGASEGGSGKPAAELEGRQDDGDFSRASTGPSSNFKREDKSACSFQK